MDVQRLKESSEPIEVTIREEQIKEMQDEGFFLTRQLGGLARMRYVPESYFDS